MTKPIDVAVVVLDGAYASTAIGPAEVFHAAGTLWQWLRGEHAQPRFRVRTATIDGRPVTTPYGFAFVPQSSIDAVEHADLVVVGSSDWTVFERTVRTTAFVDWLRACHGRGAMLAGVCTGAAYLAESGLLDGRRATTHWAAAEQMRARFPAVRWQPEQFVTEDGRLLCSGGVYASIDLALYLVEKTCGHEVALQCARSLLLSLPRSLQSGYGLAPLSRPHADERIRQAEAWLQAHFGEPVAIDALAARLAMSPRTFTRRFRAATGRGPGDYLQGLRVAAARELLERGRLPVQRVCERVGYEDVAFFRALFKRHTGMTPAQYRARFSPISLERGELAAADPRSAGARPA